MFKRVMESKIFTPTAVGICGTFLAFAVTCIRGIENTSFPDAPGILDQAHGIVHGWAFMLSNPLHSQFPMGLSALLALTFIITHSTSLLLIKILFAMGHGASTYLVARIGVQMGLKKPFWLLAAICFSLDPFVLTAATDVQTESITTLIVLFWALLYISPFPNTRLAFIRVLGFTLSGSIAIAVRPNIILPFLLVAILMFSSWHRAEIKTSYLAFSTSIFLGSMTLFEVFLTRLYQGFVFLGPNGGLNSVLTCRTEFIPQYVGYASVSENTRINHWYYAYLQDMTKGILAKQQTVSVPALNHELYNVGISSCLAHPIQSIGVVIIKSIALWRPFTVFGAYSPKVVLISFFVWVPLTVATGWYIANSKLSKVNAMLRNYFVVIAIGFTISLIPSSTQIRHRIAFAEAFYWLFFTYLLAHLLAKRTASKRMAVSRDPAETPPTS